MPEPVKVNVVSYGGVKPGQVVVGNGADGERTFLFNPDTDTVATEYLFRDLNLPTEWTADLPNLTKGKYMFHSCKGLKSFAASLHSMTSAQSMFRECTALESFRADLGSLTTGGTMFVNCSKLASFESDLSGMTTGYEMFYGCSSLTSFESDLRSLTEGSEMFKNCTKLASFRAGPQGLKSLTNGRQMFIGCKLDSASVQHILETINPDVSAGAITIGVDASKVSQEQQDTFDAGFLAKNWTVTWQRN